MFSRLNNVSRFLKTNQIFNNLKRFGSSHGHGHSAGPHVPEFYDKLGKFCLLTAYLWILYRIQQDNGQLLGLYQPWLHEHHHEHIHYVDNETEGSIKYNDLIYYILLGDSMPVLKEEEEDEHEEGHGDDHDEDEE